MLSYLLDGVEYRPYNHLYAVSRCGKFLRKGKSVTPRLRQDGYLEIGKLLAHRAVASVWCGKPDDTNHVHHKNHIKTDNRSENLEWITPQEHFGDRHKETNGKHKLSEESKNKIRITRLGTKASEQTKRKQREANLRLGIKPLPRPIGYKCSAESREKMRINHPRTTPCIIFGVTYSSVHHAAKILGIKRTTIRKRCLSNNFSEYQLQGK